MIITQQDIDEFEKRYTEAQAKYIPGSDTALFEFYKYLNNNPQIIMASGFQEYVSSHKLPLFESLVAAGELSPFSRPIFRNASGQWVVISYIDDEPNYKWDAYNLSFLEANYKKSDKLQNGALLHYDEALISLPSFSEFLNNAKQYVKNPLVDPTVFVSPKLWTPGKQESEKKFLESSSLQIIQNIQNEKIELKAIHWRKFEEIVAEVLREQGMEIHLVKESPQGGRDIIGRMRIPELDEFITVAIEVKHRQIVDRPLIQTALYQNSQFPALMVVTSGRFTSGVIKEMNKSQNTMRLFLKDGVAIRDMINKYPVIQ